MGKNTKFVKDVLRVSLSNIIKLLAGVLVGLLLPKIIGVTDYGYYKTYTLYIHYVGLFHFGISDGIYLLFGGKDYSELDRKKFRFYSKAFIAIEALVSVVLTIIAVTALSEENKFIFACVASYLLANNVTGYYQMISQITGRFKELSRRNLIQSVFISATVIVLYVIHRFLGYELTYRPYTLIYSILIALLAIWYIVTYKDISFGESSKFSDQWKDIPSFIKVGFPLTVANLCSTLILSLDRQFVNVLFDTDTYAVYAFAYNMLALVTTAVSAVSTVLYPKLKRTNRVTLKANYSILTGTIAVLVSASLCIYFPLCWFVNWFLPKYVDSLLIFRIIFPGLIISSVITIIMHNYYKVLGINNKFFIKSLITLLVSGFANYVAYRFFGTTSSISIASIITMVFWYFLVESHFVKEFNIAWKKNVLFIFCIMTSFYITTNLNNLVLGLFLYILMNCACVALFYRNEIRHIMDTKTL